MKKIALPAIFLVLLLLAPLILGVLIKFKIEDEHVQATAKYSIAIESYEMGYWRSSVVYRIEVTDYVLRQDLDDANLPKIFFVDSEIRHWQPDIVAEGVVRAMGGSAVANMLFTEGHEAIRFRYHVNLLTREPPSLVITIQPVHYQDATHLLQVESGQFSIPLDIYQLGGDETMNCRWPGMRFSSPSGEFQLSDVSCQSQAQAHMERSSLHVSVLQFQSLEMLEPLQMRDITLAGRQQLRRSKCIDAVSEMQIGSLQLGEVSLLHDFYLRMTIDGVHKDVVALLNNPPSESCEVTARLREIDPIFDMINIDTGYTSTAGDNRFTLKFSVLPGFIQNPQQNSLLELQSQLTAADYKTISAAVPQLLLLEKLSWLAWNEKSKHYQIEGEFRHGEISVNRYPVSMKKMQLVLQAMQTM